VTHLVQFDQQGPMHSDLLYLFDPTGVEHAVLVEASLRTHSTSGG
jgi:hypothetical protein